MVAKVSAVFTKEPQRARKAKVREARRIVEADYREIRSETPTPLLPRPPRSPYAPAYSVFGVDENGLPKNVIGDTIVGITSATRARAVREGDAVAALAAALVEQVVVDTARKRKTEGSATYWS